jgi:putative radical SAM enzyme (TIGR03279 family)
VAGLTVKAVEADSALAAAGLQQGDVILAVDSLVPRDVIDLQTDLAGAKSLTVQRGPQRRQLEVEAASAEGLVLEDPVPGGIRTCNNHCEFCFIRGLPSGLRPTLYIFDDDYRYSFLWGNFLTLTNLEESDWERIGFQRLSPLNVSVHATDPAVRRQLLNNRQAPEILPQLRRLAGMGIQVNAQVVLCAGINDGKVLEATVHDLAELYPAVRSLSVVPVGLTRFSRVRNIRRPTHQEAAAALIACEQWQTAFRSRSGVGFVYPSDELYMLAGRAEVPPASAYDGFPALANGVGMLRGMLDEWERLLSRRRKSPPERNVAWLTGALARPALDRMADRWASFAGWRPVVHCVDNRFFGEGVSVSGLLAGADLVAALRQLPDDVDDVVIPRTAFGFDGRETLDGVAAEAVGAAHPGRVHLASTPRELLEILAG